jgi:hypothetical protein
MFLIIVRVLLLHVIDVQILVCNYISIQGASRKTDVLLRNIHFKNVRFPWRTLYMYYTRILHRPPGVV